MSLKGRLLQHGIATGVTASQARAYARQGLLVESPTNGPFKGAAGNHVDPSHSVEFMDDFFAMNFHNTDEVGWKETDVAGTNTVSIVNSINGSGEVLLYTGTNSGDCVQLQWHHVIVQHTADKKLWFEVMVAPGSNSTDALMGVGLMQVNADCIGSSPTKGIWFEKSTSNVWSSHSLDTVEQTTAFTAPSVASTYQRMGFLYDGKAAKIDFMVNDVIMKTHETTTGLPEGVAFAPFLAIQSAGANEGLYCDYIKVMWPRP